MIVSFEGQMGSGKTTGAVALGSEEAKRTNRKIISNIHLNLDNYQHFDIAWFLEHIADHEIEDSILILDEMYQIMDNRSTSTKLNKLLTYFVVQTRKREVDLYLCTHYLSHIDLKMRRVVDIRGTCRYYPERPCRKCKCKECGGSGEVGKGIMCPVCHGVGGTGTVNGKPCDRCLGYGELGWVRTLFLDRRLRRRYSIEIFGPSYWHLFNTKERIPMQARILAGIDTLEVGAVY